MPGLIEWIYGQQLLKRWGLTLPELQEVMKNAPLDGYMEYPDLFNRQTTMLKMNIDNLRLDPTFEQFGLDQLKFKLADVENLENDHPELTSHGALTTKEKRELGRLRQAKQVAEERAIAAAIAFAKLFVQGLDHPVTAPELEDELRKNHLNFPNMKFRKIWEAIPQKYRSTGGRPRKNPKH